MAHDSNNEHEKALASFLRAIEVDPSYYRNHQAVGSYFYNRASYEQASKYFARAVELAPEEPTAYFALSTAHAALGRFEEAEKELRHALVFGETANVLNALGAVLMYMGREQEAVQHFTRALARFPERYLWWMNLGTAYRRLNLRTDAERANRRGLELVEAEMKKDPRNGYVRSCLAYLSAWLGDRRRAESEVAQALQLAPGDSDTRRMAVKAYEALGRREDSLAVLSTSPAQVVADVGRYPDLADLQKDSRFQALLTSISSK
jgi:tetratricopeptide (TPR) repeat protein